MFDPKQHPRDTDGKFRATLYATPNRTYDSRRSCEDKFRQFEQDVELYKPDRQSNSVGVWNADMERSRTYEFDQFTERDWQDLQTDAQIMCDTWAQDSILLTRDNPNGESRRYTITGVDAVTAARAFADLASNDPSKVKKDYYGFGGTYREGQIEIVRIGNDDPYTQLNVNRLDQWLDDHEIDAKQTETQCDAKLVINSNKNSQHRIDEETKKRYTTSGAIQPGSGDESTDPELSNTPEQMQSWVGEHTY